MWNTIIGIIPSGSILLCTILSAAIPMLVYAVNRQLHKRSDPPWKTQIAGTQGQSGGNVAGSGRAQSQSSGGAQSQSGGNGAGSDGAQGQSGGNGSGSVGAQSECDGMEPQSSG